MTSDLLRAFGIVFLLAFTCSWAHADHRNKSIPVKLGATIPLSGDSASYGQLIRDGLILAQTHLRSEGYNIELVLEDVPAPGPNAITALRKMLSVDRIDALTANFFNGNIPAMAPILTQAALPAFHTAIADDLILSSSDFVFSTNGTIAVEAKLVADYATQQLAARRAVILYVGSTFGEGYAKHFARNFEKAGGKILFEQLSPLGQDDHRADLLRVQKLKPDVIFAAFFGTNLGAVIKQIRQLNITAPILSVYEAEDPSVIATGGAGAEGLRFFEPEPLADTSLRTEFKEQFKASFGYEARVLAANAYDAARLLTKALTECRKESNCVKAKLHEVQQYDGASGVFSIAAHGAAVRPFTLKHCRAGRFEALDTPLRARLDSITLEQGKE